MKNFIFIAFIYSYGFSSIIHDKPPYFIAHFPTVLELFWTDKENPQYAQIFYKELLEKEYKISTMACNQNGCRAIIPAQSEASFKYFIKIKLCSGRVVESEILTVQMRPLPNWQTDVETQSGFINLYGNSRELKGFISDKVLFREYKVDEVQKPNRVLKKQNIETKYQQENSWWSFWGNDSDLNSHVEQRVSEPEYNKNSFQYQNYEEIFTP